MTDHSHEPARSHHHIDDGEYEGEREADLDLVRRIVDPDPYPIREVSPRRTASTGAMMQPHILDPTQAREPLVPVVSPDADADSEVSLLLGERWPHLRQIVESALLLAFIAALWNIIDRHDGLKEQLLSTLPSGVPIDSAHPWFIQVPAWIFYHGAMLSAVGVIVAFAPFLHGRITAMVRMKPIVTRQSKVEWNDMTSFMVTCIAFTFLFLSGLIFTSLALHFNGRLLADGIALCTLSVLILSKRRIDSYLRSRFLSRRSQNT